MILESFPVGIFQCNCFVLGDEATREAIVIDPGGDVEAIRDVLDQHRLSVEAIVHTHGHLDHIGAAGALKGQRGGRVHLHGADLPLWQTYPGRAAEFGIESGDLPAPDLLIEDGSRISVGSLRLDVIATPGHTPGSVCLRMDRPGTPPILFSGDTLFCNGIGRTDLWGGDYRTILASIRDRIFALPEDTLVHPGHGPATSVRDEKRSNPFLPEILKVP